MNGARADPCANTTSAPTRSITKRIGSSHHFLRTRMKAHSSRASVALLIDSILELSRHVRAAARARLPLDPIAPLPGLVHEGVLAQQALHASYRHQEDEVHDAHEDGRRHLGEQRREAHPGPLDRAEPR